MTKIHYYSGLRVIGGTVVEIETETTRCLFDFGFCVNDDMDAKVILRQNHMISDYLRLGMIPKVDGIYAKNDLEDMDMVPYENEKKQVFFIISHMHIDHCQGLGMLAPEIPVYMSEESKKMYFALHEAEDDFFRHHENVIGLPKETPVLVGDITIESIPVDHDVIGACGFLISTKDGVVAYTGDYRLHGYHPEVTRHFAQRAHRADVCITEGVSASFVDKDLDHTFQDENPPRTETLLLEEVLGECQDTSGLIIINPYERNVERVHQLKVALQKIGRTLVLEPLQVQLLKAYYPEEEYVMCKEICESVSKAYVQKLCQDKQVKLLSVTDIAQDPGNYVMQLLYEHTYYLFDLPIKGQKYLHLDGSPLGDYDPSYHKLQVLLEQIGMEFKRNGTGGHSSPMALKEVLTTMAPYVITPLHSFQPEMVTASPAMQIMPQAGITYEIKDHMLQEI